MLLTALLSQAAKEGTLSCNIAEVCFPWLQNLSWLTLAPLGAGHTNGATWQSQSLALAYAANMLSALSVYTVFRLH